MGFSLFDLGCLRQIEVLFDQFSFHIDHIIFLIHALLCCIFSCAASWGYLDLASKINVRMYVSPSLHKYVYCCHFLSVNLSTTMISNILEPPILDIILAHICKKQKGLRLVCKSFSCPVTECNTCKLHTIWNCVAVFICTESRLTAVYSKTSNPFWTCRSCAEYRSEVGLFSISWAEGSCRI